MTILEPTVGEPLLSVENLSVKFGRFTALKPMSYTIRRGQTLAVVGEFRIREVGLRPRDDEATSEHCRRRRTDYV